MSTTPLRRPLGAVPSPADHRDYRVASLDPGAAAKLPAVYLIPDLPPVRDQGQEGTCESHAAVGIADFYEGASGWGRKLSVRDLYEAARRLEPVKGEGATTRSILKAAQQQGICLESDWPYVAGQKGEPLPSAAINRPLNKVGAYAQVATSNVGVRGALVHHGPLLCVIPVTDGFWTPDAQGRVDYRGTVEGYHAIVLVGYDDTREAYRLRNSWGAGWGEGGYCWLPYDHPVTEAWTLTPNIAAPPAPPRPWWWFW